MESINQDQFKQYIPIELVKGTDGNGNDVVKFKGIASTASEDADGEFLDPRGFNAEYFLTKGVINWNHQSKTSPKASFIGKPTGARITTSGDWEVSGDIYANLPMGKEVVELQKGLAKYGMCLGMSIEGQAVQRDPKNPKRVLKANITGLAITPTPKNADTTVELIKGMGLDNLKNPCICESGICDCLLQKSMDTTAAEPITKESLDDEIKVDAIDGGKKKDDEDKEKNTKMSKATVLEKLLISLPSENKGKALEIYNVLENLSKGMVNKEIKEGVDGDVLEKALAFLSEDKASTTVIEKSISDEELLQKRNDAEKLLNDLNKACDSKGLTKAKDGDEDDESKKNKKDDCPTTGDCDPKDNMKKSVEPDLIKGDLIKGAVFSALNELGPDSLLVKSITNTVLDSLNAKFQATGQLHKGVIDSLSEQNDLLTKMAEAPSTPKSVTNISALEKGFDGGGPQLTKVGKTQAVNTLMKGLEAGEFKDTALANEVQILESSGQAGNLVKAQLAKEGMTL